MKISASENNPTNPEMPPSLNQPGEQIRVEKIKVKDLVAFAQSVIQGAEAGQFIPITLQRAAAHAQNPLADPEDIALLVAYLGDHTETVETSASPGEIVGFFGIMPVLLKVNGHFEKVYWFSTWRVAPELRGKSVGSLLMREALSLKKDFLIVGSGPARKVCRRFGFWEHAPLIYYQLDLSGMPRLNPGIWISRLFRRLLRPFKIRISIPNRFSISMERIVSILTRPLFTWLVRQHLAKHQNLANTLSDLKSENVERVRNETEDQLALMSPIQLFRGADVVNWMLEYPWVVEPGESPTEQMDFYFSDVRPEFKIYALELTDRTDGSYKGYIVFQASQSLDQRIIKTLDAVFCEPGDERNILPLAFRYAREFSAHQVDLPAEAVNEFQNTWLGKILLNRRERIYQCKPASEDSPLARSWEEIRFLYTDGDMPFS